MEDIRSLIAQQNYLLHELIGLMKSKGEQSQLGFCEAPYARTIHANRSHDCNWYFWNGSEQKAEPISQNAITAFIEKLEIKETEYKGKPDYKLRVHIRSDRRYVIQSGWDTLFSKGLLYTLSRLPVRAFETPLVIAARAGDDDKVLFCDVYKPSGEQIYCPYDESTTDWNQVFDRACQKVDAANNRNPQAEANGNGRSAVAAVGGDR